MRTALLASRLRFRRPFALLANSRQPPKGPIRARHPCRYTLRACRRQPHSRPRGGARCLRACERAPPGRSRPLSAAALALARADRAGRHSRVHPRLRAGRAAERADVFRAGDPRRDLQGAAGRDGGLPPPCACHHAVLHHRRAAGAGFPSWCDHRQDGAVLGQPRRVRRHQFAGGETGGRRLARPRARAPFGGSASPAWRHRGGRQPARAGLPLRLFLPQRGLSQRRQEDGQGRPAHAGRDRHGGGDQQDPERAAAHLGILGDPARQTRRNAAARGRGRRGTQSIIAAPGAARDCCQGASEQEEDTMKRIAIAAGALALLTLPAAAEDSFKVAIGQINNWENQAPTLGQDVGIFKKHGIVLDNFGTAGAGETMQPIISGSADIGAGVGVAGVMRAFSKGAPVRIISPAFTGTGDLYWYVKGDSPIKSLKDLTAQNTIAYSTNGSSRNNIVGAFVNELGAKAKPTATGGPPATLTAVMSGQIDVGWAAPPFGLKEIKEGKIRIIARGSDVPSLRGQTVRGLIDRKSV